MKNKDHVEHTDQNGDKQLRFFLIGYCPAHLDPKSVAARIEDVIQDSLFFQDGVWDEFSRIHDGNLGVSFAGRNKVAKLLAKMKKLGGKK